MNSFSAIMILSYCKRLTKVWLLVFLVLVGCSENNPLHPSFDELTQRGFYVYVLPKSEIEKREWLQTVTIWSWDRHCKGIEPAETANPIHVTYQGQEEQSRISLTLGPWSMAWDHNQPTTPIKLDVPWASNTARYYTINNNVYLRFEDQFGIPIQVNSNLSLTEVVKLVNRLEYIGPSQETVTNPWDLSKCDNLY